MSASALVTRRSRRESILFILFALMLPIVGVENVCGSGVTVLGSGLRVTGMKIGERDVEVIEPVRDTVRMTVDFDLQACKFGWR